MVKMDKVGRWVNKPLKRESDSRHFLANFLANKQAQKQAELDAQTAETQQRLMLANQQLVEANLALEQTKLAQASILTPTNKILIGILRIGALGAGLYFMQQNKAQGVSAPKVGK